MNRMNKQEDLVRKRLTQNIEDEPDEAVSVDPEGGRGCEVARPAEADRLVDEDVRHPDHLRGPRVQRHELLVRVRPLRSGKTWGFSIT